MERQEAKYDKLMREIFTNAQTAHNSRSRSFLGDASDLDEPELSSTIEQMMFVSGETADPSTETTGLIEEIVREQVVQMVCTLSTILWQGILLIYI